MACFLMKQAKLQSELANCIACLIMELAKQAAGLTQSEFVKRIIMAYWIMKLAKQKRTRKLYGIRHNKSSHQQ